jgi:hypothetical protein
LPWNVFDAVIAKAGGVAQEALQRRTTNWVL